MKNWMKGASVAVLASASLGAAAHADNVIADDQIVQGSMCVGIDCVNGENFGFDTLRLKENNLRMHFEDTSTTASFPTTDWRFTFNDSSNGGLSHFSVDDVTASTTPFRVEGGAASNTLVVDSRGVVGIGTNSPSLDLHIVSGNTPSVRLDQDGSSGFTPQIWDVGGNEANFFVRNVTNASALPFRIRGNAPGNSIYVADNGDVGLSTQNPAHPLHIVRNTGGALQFITMQNDGPSAIRFDNNEVTNPADWRMGQSSNSTDFLIVTPDSPGPEFALTLTGDLEILGNFVSGGATLNVPDYVFADDYELMSLDEVEAFIGENNHLPHIASAAEIAENGVNLSQMQMDLLKTVEELTLHTLAQQAALDAQIEANAAQQAALEAQAAEIAALRARLDR